VPQPESKEALLRWPGFFFDPLARGHDDNFAWLESPGYAPGYFDTMIRWLRATARI
jgi:hypothetical protein